MERLAAYGEGVVLMPVREGTPMRGLGSPEVYRSDGWKVGYVTPGGGCELTVEPTIAEAVEAARVERELTRTCGA